MPDPSRSKRTSKQAPQSGESQSSKPHSGKVQPGKTQSGKGQPGKVRSGKAQPGKAQPGKVRSPKRRQSANLSAPLGQPTSSLMSMNLDEKNVDSTLIGDQLKRCKKCGSPIESGQCTGCKFIEPVYERLYLPLDEIPIRLVGFQRWFCKTMSEGFSIRLLELLFHVLVAGSSLCLIAVGVGGALGYGIGPLLGSMLMVSVFILDLLYIGFVHKGRQFLRNPDAQLAWFQKPFWRLMLGISRKLKWHQYDNRFDGRSVITVREKSFGDLDFVQLDCLKECEVLDLDGTCVTDETIKHLYAMERLCCVVVRKTYVSSEAIFRFQQTFPKVWIWN